LLCFCQGSEEQQTCGSQQIAIRISFANFCFFALHGLLLLFLKQDEDPRVEIHGSLWVWKTVLWAGALIGFFFVPADAIIGYAQVPVVSSLLPASFPFTNHCLL
jgi:hypothetical protein